VLNGLIVPTHLACIGRRQATDDAQQTGFTHPVVTLEVQRLASVQLKADIGKQGLVATAA
jgi:hypothetical protein